MYTGKPVVTTAIDAGDLRPGMAAPAYRRYREWFADEPIIAEHPDYFRKIGHNALNFIRMHFDNLKVAGELADFYQEQLS
jgi:hypothetical protein